MLRTQPLTVTGSNNAYALNSWQRDWHAALQTFDNLLTASGTVTIGALADINRDDMLTLAASVANVTLELTSALHQMVLKASS